MSNQHYYNSNNAPPTSGAPPNQQYSSPPPPQNQNYTSPSQQPPQNHQYPSQPPPNQQHAPLHSNPQHQYAPPSGPPPTGFPPPRRTDTEALLPQGQERSEQLEYMQSYEQRAEANQTEDDAHQAILQREFPEIDSSLIAAIYGDSKSLSATREMLQELGGSG